MVLTSRNSALFLFGLMRFLPLLRPLKFPERRDAARAALY